MSYFKVSKQSKQILTSWLCIGLLTFVIGFIIGTSSNRPKTVDEVNETESKPTVNTATESEPTPIQEYIYTSLGEYRLTAYCACEKCCGTWATNRPLDEDGNPIVYTANQSIAKQGVTIAADTSVHPFGTVLLIDGHEYTVQDRGGAIKGNRIDIFFDNHHEALEFGVQYKEIFIKEKNQ